MSTREIVTLQFGHYSNYVGAHFWNIQDLSFDYTGTVKSECNHDILYREGLTDTGQVTYTPRLLLADLKGSLKTLPENGGLEEDYEIPECTNIWNTVEKLEEPKPDKNEFLNDLEAANSTDEPKSYNLESKVGTWTDYLYPRFHKRTVNIVKDYQHGESEKFDIFCTGKSIWKSDFGDDFSDNIRKYVEECDSMQGFVINFDAVDGFSGLALGCIEYLTDEYNKSILAHPIISSHFPDNNPTNQDERDKSIIYDSQRLINLALSIDSLSEHCKLFIPLCTGSKGWRKPGIPRNFDHVEYNPEIYYHSSALLASAMDTLSYKYRLKSNEYGLSDICADLTGYGRKMAAASMGLPFGINKSKYLIEQLNEVTKPIYTCITPNCKIGNDKLFQIMTIRGIPESYLKAPLDKAKEQRNLAAYRCNTVKEMFELYFQSTNFLSATQVVTSEQPLKVKSPYPQFFSKSLNNEGFVCNDSDSETVESVPIIAGYHNGTFISDMLEKLHRETSRIKFSKLHRFSEEGLESSEFQETLDRLSEFKDNYEDEQYL